ncbi:hypothetical protein [Clostridium beijerinckii]|nr:hypothetical protein [Clostridium beijerinckii]
MDSAFYAFNERGQMYYDCFTPDGFVVDADGFWIK